MEALYAKKEFLKQDRDFRIGAIISDGMWWSIPKWKNKASVTEKELRAWIEQKLAEGILVQSETGARSYRLPLESIIQWYDDHGFTIGDQLLESLFPPRIWGGMTETEGLLQAPRREIGVVTFVCSPHVAREVIQNLVGVAKVRESEPGVYRAYSLSSAYVKDIVQRIFDDKQESEIGKIRSRVYGMRRELVDFPNDFVNGMLSFYTTFCETLVKHSMDTIRIFIPDEEDQQSQFTYWTISAIEKFDEKSSVPFSGYFDAVLRRWPYDLPYERLGKDLSNFQRARSRAINILKQRSDENNPHFTHNEIAKVMGMNLKEFTSLEERHNVWLSAKHATQLTWSDSSDEKQVLSQVNDPADGSQNASSDTELAHRITVAAVQAAINTHCYSDALILSAQVDEDDIDISKLNEMSRKYIAELDKFLDL